ncbi:MAG: hypothetical protein RL434_2440 [Pseudomonadota bacterium]|jgi:nitroimidazol reductase NimA-like FMN-containing flavoprotein (pyridoxamine 5'-phosphate oxidase superfamily)
MSETVSRRLRSLDADAIATLLSAHHSPVRLSSLSPNGYPLISTLWFLFEEGCFWCITHQSTLMRRNLAANPRCAFEITLDDARYKLLRGQGDAELHLEQGRRITEAMISRYLPDPAGAMAEALRARIPTEYAVRIVPRWVRGSGAQRVKRA